jgi:predicted RNase H-like HicB family nuclease
MGKFPVDHRIKGGWRMKIKVYLEESEDGGYTAIVPSLPGCISEGDTREEALENIREAIELYLEPVEDDVLSLGLSEEVELAI